MKGINFNTEMVQAILDGRKTQFRRVCNQPSKNACKNLYVDNYNNNPNLFAYWCKDGRLHDYIEPKYKIGDILYVKETFLDDYAIGGEDENKNPVNVIYKADSKDKGTYPNWKPSIHMTKENARIFLKITNVRVERLQDITCDDILDEGYNELISNVLNYEWWVNLWNSKAKENFTWDDNPYVFVYDFEVVEEKN